MTVSVLKCRMLHFLCMPYIQFKSTNLHTTVCVVLIERDWIGLTVQRHCDIEKKKKYGHKGENTKLERQKQETHLRHCKPWLTTWSTIVALISSEMHLCHWPLMPFPLFCLCTLPPCILTPLLPLCCWPWSFPGCSSIVRICNPCVVLCLYAYQIKIHEMHLWAISENWFIIGWSTFSSLVKVKIHMTNLQKV